MQCVHYSVPSTELLLGYNFLVDSKRVLSVALKASNFVGGVNYAKFFVCNAILKFPDNDTIMLRNDPIMLMVLAIILVKSSIKSA